MSYFWEGPAPWREGEESVTLFSGHFVYVSKQNDIETK